MLKRAFFSLYLIVVVAILVVGWGLDRFYLSVAKAQGPEAAEQLLFALIEEALDASQAEGLLAAQLQTLAHPLNLQADLYRLDDFAHSELAVRIRTGELVLVTDARASRELYQRLQNSTHVIRLQIPVDGREQRWLADGLLLLFYLALAVVIYLWIWPLIRDLRSLEQQARQVGRGKGGERVSLHSGSAVYPLASEFNRMQDRLDELLGSYREMTYAVSHELRTPLARMKFALELAEQLTQSSGLQKHFDSLRADVTDMDSLINQLLSYAGFESQTQVLMQQPGDIAALTEEQFHALVSLHPTLDYQLINELGDSPVYCEWPLMERVLHNLLGNAARYAKTRIVVSLRLDRGGVEVRVEDDGPGIPVIDRERIFDSFVRLRNSETETKGFGLGLAIVRRIMRWHQGSCRVVDSGLGGACFVLRWPQPAPSNRTFD